MSRPSGWESVCSMEGGGLAALQRDRTAIVVAVDIEHAAHSAATRVAVVRNRPLASCVAQPHAPHWNHRARCRHILLRANTAILPRLRTLRFASHRLPWSCHHQPRSPASDVRLTRRSRRQQNRREERRRAAFATCALPNAYWDGSHAICRESLPTLCCLNPTLAGLLLSALVGGRSRQPGAGQTRPDETLLAVGRLRAHAALAPCTPPVSWCCY